MCPECGQPLVGNHTHRYKPVTLTPEAAEEFWKGREDAPEPRS